MMKLITLTFLFLSACSTAFAGESLIRGDVGAQWDRVPPDKKLHFAVEAQIGFFFSTFTHMAPDAEDDGSGLPPLTPRARLVGSSGMCLAFGVGKEAMDEFEYRWPDAPFWKTGGRTRGAELGDLAADVAGCAVGVGAGALLGTGIRYTIMPGCVSCADWWGATVAFEF